jgi:hypothetical protein
LIGDATTSNTLAFANFSTAMDGGGKDYLGRATIASGIMGKFLIPANTPFTFDLIASVLLENQTDDVIAAPVSSTADIQLRLQNLSNFQDLNLINFVGALNTGSLKNNADNLTLITSPNFNSVISGSQLLSDPQHETVKFFFDASYTMMFDQETEVALAGILRTCNYSASTPQTCVNVPEPSTKLGLIAALIFLSSVGIKKQIRIFSHQPFVKHLLKNFIANLRR